MHGPAAPLGCPPSAPSAPRDWHNEFGPDVPGNAVEPTENLMGQGVPGMDEAIAQSSSVRSGVAQSGEEHTRSIPGDVPETS